MAIFHVQSLQSCPSLLPPLSRLLLNSDLPASLTEALVITLTCLGTQVSSPSEDPAFNHILKVVLPWKGADIQVQESG
jgi:hypothetical protein